MSKEYKLKGILYPIHGMWKVFRNHKVRNVDYVYLHILFFIYNPVTGYPQPYNKKWEASDTYQLVQPL